MPSLHEYLTIKSAAEFLGVTQNTLRNWGAARKITEYRHPINNYRLDKSHDLKRLLTSVERSGTSRQGKASRRKPR
jgi:excisionase family DNA binding protein